MNGSNIIITILVFIIVLLITVIFYVDKFKKIRIYLAKIISVITTNLYLFLIPFPLLYLFYYYFYYDEVKNSNANTSFLYQKETIEYFKGLSIIFFSGGVFSATIKMINNFVLFKKNFQKLILSDDFDNLLKDKFQILSLSDDFLLKRTDIHDIWTRVTTCQFEQKFPKLKTSILKKLENDFFTEKMLSYYYHNFRTQINLELMEGTRVKITEICNFDLIPNTNDPIALQFRITSELEENNSDIYTKLIEDECKVDKDKMQLIEKALLPGEFSKTKTYVSELKGKEKYTIERKIEMTQDLVNDRVFSFSSSIIIDDMSVNIQCCDNLGIFFSPAGKNKFDIDNHIHSGKSYIAREVLLPGEKFKIFIFKK